MKKKKWNKYINLLMQLAMSMVLSIFLFLFMGLFIDKYIDGTGIIVVGFVFLGVLCGFYVVYLKLKSFF